MRVPASACGTSSSSHHDLWDMDNPTPATLLTVRHDGEWVDIAAQGTKMGLLYVFDRVTGEPLWPIEERPAPVSELPDMQAWPTQPFPTWPPPLIRQEYTLDDVSDISPEAQQLTTDLITQSGAYGSFPPPSLEQKIKFPGYDGGHGMGRIGRRPRRDTVRECQRDAVVLPAHPDEASGRYAPASRGPVLPFALRVLPRSRRQRRSGRRLSGAHGYERALQPGAAMALLVQGGARMPAFDQVPEEFLNMILDHLFGEETAMEEDEEEDEEYVPPYGFRGFQRWLDHEGYPAIKRPGAR